MAPNPSVATAGVTPPGPRGLPALLDVVRRYRRDSLGLLRDLVRDYGNVVNLPLGTGPVYLVNEPALIHAVLVTGHRHFIKSAGLQMTRGLLGEGLLTSEGALHRHRRHLLQPCLQPRAAGRWARTISELAATGAARWQPGEEIDVHGQMAELTLAVICEVLGAPIARPDLTRLADALTLAQRRFRKAIGSPVAIVTRSVFGAGRDVRHLERLVYRMVDAAQRNPTGAADTVLPVLLAAEDAGGGRLTRRALRDEVVTLLVAGSETTANTLSWACYLLARHEAAALRLHAEVDAVLAPRGRRNEVVPLEAGDLERLPYTRRVITETLRLYPPAYLLGRQAVADVVLEGYRIPAGTTLLMSQYLMHRDARFFPDPEMFLPDRWAAPDPGSAAPALPRCAFFPFGDGPRVCIGEPLAWLEATLILAAVSYRWRLRLPPNAPEPVPEPRITLRPRGGLRLVPEPR